MAAKISLIFFTIDTYVPKKLFKKIILNQISYLNFRTHYEILGQKQKSCRNFILTKHLSGSSVMTSLHMNNIFYFQ